MSTDPDVLPPRPRTPPSALAAFGTRTAVFLVVAGSVGALCVAFGFPPDSPGARAGSPSPVSAMNNAANSPADNAAPVAEGQPVPGASRSNADKAYCRGQGTVVQVAASATFRGAICSVNGALAYFGLNKDTGGTIELPASDTGSGYIARNAPNTSYELTSAQYSVVDGAGQRTAERMVYWWPAGDPELGLPGDLGLSQPISYPDCDGSGIVVLGTSFDPGRNEAHISALLQQFPGSSYLRTDLSCGSFVGPSAANSGGKYIYAVYKSAGRDPGTVCAAITAAGTYGKWLSNDASQAGRFVQC